MTKDRQSKDKTPPLFKKNIQASDIANLLQNYESMFQYFSNAPALIEDSKKRFSILERLIKDKTYLLDRNEIQNYITILKKEIIFPEELSSITSMWEIPKPALKMEGLSLEKILNQL